jgi:hypothetical protein
MIEVDIRDLLKKDGFSHKQLHDGGGYEVWEKSEFDNKLVTRILVHGSLKNVFEPIPVAAPKKKTKTS